MIPMSTTPTFDPAQDSSDKAMDPRPLWTLPPELIFRILDFIEPEDYGRFAAMFPCAFQRVKQKLEVLNKAEFESYMARNNGTFPAFEVELLDREGRLGLVTVMETSACYPNYDPNVNEPDL